MARISRIDKEEVRAACVTIRNRDLRVTLNAVFDELGRKGSIDVVRRFWREWLDEADSLSIPGAPDSFNDALRNFANAAWTSAREIAENSLSKEREAATDASMRAREAADEVIAKAEERINQAEGARHATELRLAEMASSLTQSAEIIRNANRRIGELESAHALLKTELQAARNENEVLRNKLEETAGHLQSKLEDAEKTHAEEMQLERDRYDGERRFLQKNIDEQRLAMERRISDLQQGANEAKKGAVAASRRYMERIDKLTALNERARHDMAQSMQGMMAMQEEVRRINDDRNQLTGQVATLQVQIEHLKSKTRSIDKTKKVKNETGKV